MIPDYQSLMLPLLKIASDGAEHRISGATTLLEKKLGLTDAETVEMLHSGKQTIFSNRAHWAKTYMAQAKLLESTKRAHFRITERGRQILQSNPAKIDAQALEQFPEFVDFKKRSREAQKSSIPMTEAAAPEVDAVTKLATPDELLRTTIADLDLALGSELLDRVMAAPPAFFESLIVDLLLKMGYGGSREEAGRAIGKVGMVGLTVLLTKIHWALIGSIFKRSDTKQMRQ
jgi:restriction system protein